MAIQDLVDGNAGEHAQAQQGKSGGEADQDERECLKGVRHLCESGITRLPSRYVLPVSDRPGWSASGGDKNNTNLRLPVIDLARLRLRSERASVLRALDAACREFGFFQVVNHGFDEKVIRGTLDVARRFFEQPIEERARHMTSDIRSLVRYGTSFNQLNDGVLCWRDFLKLVCQPLDAVVPSWPHSPPDLREVVSAYARINQCLFKELMAALLEEMGICDRAVLDDCDAGTQMMIVNCFPACPQPDLTLGMPPHSDYGFLTILLQDEVNGLEVKYGDQWIMVEPLPNSFVVNIGDHFEIYSNGRYKSVMHRVRVNSTRSRISVASLHSLPLERVISPAPELVDERNPRRYRDTDFATFLNHLTSSDGKQKSFLESRRLTS